MAQIYITYYSSPIGDIEITGTETEITSVLFVDRCQKSSQTLPRNLQICVQELAEYFNGDRTSFTVKTQQKGTPFQQRVWEQLSQIPYGTTISYLEVAQRIQSASSVRAVGNANRHNQIWVIIPCHRVIGTSGKLTGYAGGLWRKQWLLEHERKLMAPSLFDQPTVPAI